MSSPEGLFSLPLKSGEVSFGFGLGRWIRPTTIILFFQNGLQFAQDTYEKDLEKAFVMSKLQFKEEKVRL